METTIIMENQVEQKVENEMETWLMQRFRVMISCHMRYLALYNCTCVLLK